MGYTAGFTGDTYGYDTIGYGSAQVDWYQRNLSGTPGALPCSASFTQYVWIVDNISGFGNQQYVSYPIVVTIGADYFWVRKYSLCVADGISKCPAQ